VYAELIDKDWAPASFPFKPTNRVVWIQDPAGVVLAGIAYEYMAEQRNGYLVLSFTNPEYRGRGLNEICHNCYEADCKKLGAVILSSLVAVDNVSRIRSAEKVGMLPKFYRMQKNI
jgi:hypothetical protein